MAEAAEFTVEFKVDDVNHPMEKYMHVIRDVRSRLRVRFSHDRPVLPPEENPPTRWFEIILRTENYAIWLRIRCDTLYLVGYRIENSTQWFEFGSDTTNPPSPHLIAGSQFLGYCGNYDSLHTAAGSHRVNIYLGRQQLIASVDQLATGEERAKPLIVIIQMICESIRFQSIAEYLTTKFRIRDGEVPEEPPLWMLEQEQSWEDLSNWLLDLDVNPTCGFQPPRNTNIQSDVEAANALGILKGRKTSV